MIRRTSVANPLRLLFVALFLASTACSGSPKRPDPSGPAIVADSKVAQEKFDEARALLESGEFLSAREAFRILQSEHPEDPIAVVAELYIARAGMGDLGWVVSGDRADVSTPSDESVRLLAQLEADENVDRRIRAAATFYRAFLDIFKEGKGAAFARLSDYPSHILSPLVLERDLEPSYLLLASSHQANRRPVEALRAWDGLWEIHESNELSLVARSSAFDSATTIELNELQDLTTDADSRFIRAVAGWEWLRRRLAETPDEDERDDLESLFSQISGDLVAIGEVARAREHGASLATWGPVRKLVLGAAFPLSGPRADVGEQAQRALLVAQESILGTAEPVVTLLVVDSELGAEKAMKRFADAEVAAVIGPLDKARTAEFAPHARAAGIPLISLSPTALEDVESAGEWVFRFFVDAVAEARAVARVAFDDQGDTRAAILYPDVGYGRTLAAAFREEFVARGGTIVDERAYNPSKSDYSSVAAAIARKSPDAIFIPGRASKVAQLAAFLAQENVWGIPGSQRPSSRSKRTQVHYLGTSLWEDDALARQAGNYLEGALIPAWASPRYDDPESKSFYARFGAAVDRPPTLLEVVIADSVLMGRTLLLERGVSRAKAFRDTIRAPEVYDGVTGRVGFSNRGEPLRTLRFVVLEGGDFQASDRVVETGMTEVEPGASEPTN